jgi:hypothetical protein
VGEGWGEGLQSFLKQPPGSFEWTSPTSGETILGYDEPLADTNKVLTQGRFLFPLAAQSALDIFGQRYPVVRGQLPQEIVFCHL